MVLSQPSGGPTTSPTDRPRTLAEAIRAAGRDFVVELVRLRPDLGYPLPADVAELVSRAATTTSTVRALDRLDAWTRLIAEVLAALRDPATPAQLLELAAGSVGGEDDQRQVDLAAAVDRALATLRVRALLWGEDELHLTRTVREYFGPYPGGLAPPSPQELAPDRITALLAAAGPDEHDVLTRLARSPAGAVRNADRPVSLEQAATPIDRLLARGLIRPLSADTVLLPARSPGGCARAGSRRRRCRPRRRRSVAGTGTGRWSTGPRPAPRTGCWRTSPGSPRCWKRCRTG